MFVLYQTAIDESLERTGRSELQLCDGKELADYPPCRAPIEKFSKQSGHHGGGLRSDERTRSTVGKAMPKSSVCLRVTIPNLVAALLGHDLAIATAAGLPCQIQAATPVRPYAASPGRKAPPTLPAPHSPCGNDRDLTAGPEMFVCCFVER
jgi:hypothetical protein